MTRPMNPTSSANEARHNISVPVAPAKTKASQDGHERFVDPFNVAPPPYRPVIRRPLRYDLAMRLAAARAAAAQPRLLIVASNVVTWREVSL